MSNGKTDCTMLLSGTRDQPSALWRAWSSMTMLEIGALCRAFLFAASTTEIHGLESFLKLLNSRQDYATRNRGLLTVSNHVSVMDDPLIWGAIPFRHQWESGAINGRWAFGSHDICFSNRLSSLFFTLGQVLPTHRLAHSPHGGLFQPTVTQAIRLLSRGPYPPDPHTSAREWSLENLCVDPFSDMPPAYSTKSDDAYLAPSAYARNSFAWIHIFPEGKVHQSPRKTMRYFKWGVSRLILEASECPDVVPMWIEGTDQVMHESRKWPRFIPRFNKKISITFGEKADREAVFGDLRQRWQKLKAMAEEDNPGDKNQVGILNEELKYGQEAVELRKECTERVRALVLEVRRSRGLPDEDPKQGLVETWLREGPGKEGKMQDDSWIRDT